MSLVNKLDKGVKKKSYEKVDMKKLNDVYAIGLTIWLKMMWCK